MPQAVDEKATTALMSLLVGAVLAYRRDVNAAALAQHLKGQLEQSRGLIKSVFGAPAALAFGTLVQEIGRGEARGKGGMPGPKYAGRLVAIYGLMRQNKKLSTFKVSRHVTEDQASLISAALAMFAPDTATVDAKEMALDRRLPNLPDKFLRTLFVPDKKSAMPQQKQHLDELKMLVKKFVGRTDVRLTPDEARAIKEKYPDLYKRYNLLRRNVKASWQQFVRVMVRKNGGKPVQLASVLDAMKKNNVDAPALQVKGLEGYYIGENCKLYTSAMRQIQAFPAPGSKIIPNKKYDPKLDNGVVFWYEVPGTIAKRPKAAYTLQSRRDSKHSTDQYLDQHRKTVPKQRDKWLTYLRSNDRYQQTMGAIVEILYSYAVRIGGQQNATKGVPTYGLSTLRVNQVRPRAGGYLIAYPGKDNKPQKHIITPVDETSKRVITVLTRLIKGKSPKDFLWTKPDGSHISNSEINKFLKGELKLPITSHKFRNIRGTNLMEHLLSTAKVPKNLSQSQAERLVKGLALHVGELLGHVSGDKPTPNMAISRYIIPTVIKEFFEKHGLRTPKWVPQRDKAAD